MCASQLCSSVMQLINNYNSIDNYNKLKSNIIRSMQPYILYTLPIIYGATELILINSLSFATKSITLKCILFINNLN